MQIVIYEQFPCPFPVRSIDKAFLPWENRQVDLHPCEGWQVEGCQECLFCRRVNRVSGQSVCVCMCVYESLLIPHLLHRCWLKQIRRPDLSNWNPNSLWKCMGTENGRICGEVVRLHKRDMTMCLDKWGLGQLCRYFQGFGKVQRNQGIKESISLYPWMAQS